MEPSSLVLVAIIGVWAAYLVPNWIRRRDDLVQSRGLDRFSSGLRVLNRRRRSVKTGHRSGDAVLASPRVIVDADGELLFIAGDRAKAAQLRAAEVVSPVTPSKITAKTRITARVTEKPVVAAISVPVEEHGPKAAEKIAVAAAKIQRVVRIQVSVKVPIEVKPKIEASPKVDAKAATPTKPMVESKVDAKAATPTKPMVESKVDAKAAAGTKPMVDAKADPATSPKVEIKPKLKGHRKAVPVTMSTPASSQADVAVLQNDVDSLVTAGRSAATRRARIMIGLIIACLASWGAAVVLSVWIALPATLVLILHVMASRTAALRSREHLMVRSAQLQAAEQLQARPQVQRTSAPARRPAARPAPAQPAAERPARRAAGAVGNPWQPVPVPPPTYTLKPAVPRPEPAPLDLPAAHKPAAAHHPAAAAAAVSRAALPRTAADIERILALDTTTDQDGYENRTA